MSYIREVVDCFQLKETSQVLKQVEYRGLIFKTCEV